MGISSLLGGLFGRNAETSYDALSVADIESRLAPKEARAAEIHMLLQRAEGNAETEEKSRQWMLKAEKSANEARSKGDMAQLSKIKADIAEAQKRALKIEKNADKMNEELHVLEDEIELLRRALDKKKRS